MSDDKLIQIANSEHIILSIDNALINKAYSTDNEIILGVFDNSDCKIAAFFHELAHIKKDSILQSDFGKTKNNVFYYFSKLSEEALCWELGFRLAFNYGYKWSYDNIVYKYAYKNLLTYLATEQDIHLLPNVDSVNDIHKITTKLLYK